MVGTKLIASIALSVTVLTAAVMFFSGAVRATATATADAKKPAACAMHDTATQPKQMKDGCCGS